MRFPRTAADLRAPAARVRPLDLHTTASMYQAISAVDLMRIPVALPDDTTQKEIVAKVRESFDARREARRLLDEAKAMVEQTGGTA